MMASSDDDRHARGWDRLCDINGTDDPRVVRRIEELSPDLARDIVQVGYGDFHADRREDVLGARERQLVVLGALVALGGADDQLAVHINVALRVGLTPDEIIEALHHAVPFVGFPRVLNAVEAARRIFERRDVWTSDAYRAPASTD